MEKEDHGSWQGKGRNDNWLVGGRVTRGKTLSALPVQLLETGGTLLGQWRGRT